MESRNDVVESEGCVPSLSSKSDLLDAVATNHKEKLEELDINKDVAEGKTWVKVLYEGEIFIGKVVRIGINGKNNRKECCVRCLKKPYITGFKGSEFESDNYMVFYDCVYRVKNEPYIKRMGRGFQWVYELDE